MSRWLSPFGLHENSTFSGNPMELLEPGAARRLAARASRDRSTATSPSDAIREHHASVIIIDNLERLLPRIHWASPVRRLDEAVREVLRGLRGLISEFDRPIEIVLFHLKTEAQARKLLEEGYVDQIEEVRP